MAVVRRSSEQRATTEVTGASSETPLPPLMRLMSLDPYDADGRRRVFQGRAPGFGTS